MFAINFRAAAISFVSALFTGASAVVVVPQACDALGGCFVPASRAFVRDETNPLRLAQAQTSASVDRQLKFQIEQALREASKDPALPNSQPLQEYVRGLEAQKNDAQRRIEASDTQVRQLQQKQ